MPPTQVLPQLFVCLFLALSVNNPTYVCADSPFQNKGKARLLHSATITKNMSVRRKNKNAFLCTKQHQILRMFVLLFCYVNYLFIALLSNKHTYILLEHLHL